MNTSATENIINGVDAAKIHEVVKVMSEQPSLAEFLFRLTNRWVSGGLNRSRIKEFYGAGQEDTARTQTFTLENAEPEMLLGRDEAPNPVEYVLHALAGCLTTTTAYHAAAKGIEIRGIQSRFEGDLDLRGFLGLDLPGVRCGYNGIRAVLEIETDAPADEVAMLHRRSPVFDIVSNPVPVDVQVVVHR